MCGEWVFVIVFINVVVDNIVERFVNVGLNVVWVGNFVRVVLVVCLCFLSFIVDKSLIIFCGDLVRRCVNLCSDLWECFDNDLVVVGIR